VTQSDLVGFDAKLVRSLYEDVTSKYYYSQGQFRISPKYAANGIVELNATKTVSTGKAIEYYTYIPEDLDLSVEGSAPLMLWFHGMGGEAEAMMSWSEWPEIAKKDGLIVVSVDQHDLFTGEEVAELLDFILAESPYIDTSRIYASGFSMGSAKTWELGIQNWRRFAGIVPCALGVFGVDESYTNAIQEGGILPVFYLAGGQSPFELGSAAFTQNALGLIWPLNNLGEYSYDETLGQWGVTSSTTLRMPYRDDSDMVLEEAGRQQVLSIDSFESADGNTYTWLAVNENKPHTVTNNDAHVAWEYIKKFSRNADGTIAIDGITIEEIVEEDIEEDDGEVIIPPNIIVDDDDDEDEEMVEPPFTDVSKNDWFYDAVKRAYNLKLFNGVTETRFAPNDKLTRGQMITILYRAAGAPETSGAIKFSDVAQDAYYSNAVIWGDVNDIVKGKTNTIFAPDDLITREQMYVFLYRYAKYLEMDVSASDDINTFIDSADVSDYALDALSWAYAEEYLLGSLDDGILRLDPKGSATRAQAATLLIRFIEG